jgi:hypothetical protein
VTQTAKQCPVCGEAIKADARKCIHYEQVTHFQVTVPLDGSAEVRVTTPGYAPWAVRPRGEGSDKRMSGTIRLSREE